MRALFISSLAAATALFGMGWLMVVMTALLFVACRQCAWHLCLHQSVVTDNNLPFPNNLHVSSSANRTHHCIHSHITDFRHAISSTDIFDSSLLLTG